VRLPTTRIFRVVDARHDERPVRFSLADVRVIGVSRRRRGDVRRSSPIVTVHMDDHVIGIARPFTCRSFRVVVSSRLVTCTRQWGRRDLGTALKSRRRRHQGRSDQGEERGWPITETADAFYTHGTSIGDLDEALQHACEEASKLLVDEWGFLS